MYLKYFHIYWIDYCEWLWNVCFFLNFFKKKLIFLENFQNLKIFEKKWNFKKIFQTSKCSKKFAFWVMIKQKKLQRDFLTNFTILKKFLARALNLILLWKLKNHGILAQMAEYSERARAKNFFRIEKFIKFPTFYIFWMFLYHLNSWF